MESLSRRNGADIEEVTETCLIMNDYDGHGTTVVFSVEEV